MRKLMVFTATLQQNVMNPRGHMTMCGREDYFLNERGDEVSFFYDPKNMTERVARVISKIQSGEAFPIRFGTSREAWAKKFTVTDHSEYIDEEYCEE